MNLILDATPVAVDASDAIAQLLTTVSQILPFALTIAGARLVWVLIKRYISQEDPEALERELFEEDGDSWEDWKRQEAAWREESEMEAAAGRQPEDDLDDVPPHWFMEGSEESDVPVHWFRDEEERQIELEISRGELR